MKLYKLTDQNSKTRAGCYNECQWGEGVTHKAIGTGKSLCSGNYIHAYTSPYLAVLFNPLGGGYDENTMLLWAAKGIVAARETDKVGCKRLTTIKQINKPRISTEQRVEIAIRCAVTVYKETSFLRWSDEWLDGTNRTRAAAWAAVDAAWAAREAAWVAAWSAARAAAWSAVDTTIATEAATRTARDVARAARDAAWADIDIISIIKEVTDEKPVQ